MDFPAKACMTCACKVGVLVAVCMQARMVMVTKGQACVAGMMSILSVSPGLCMHTSSTRTSTGKHSVCTYDWVELKKQRYDCECLEGRRILN